MHWAAVDAIKTNEVWSCMNYVSRFQLVKLVSVIRYKHILLLDAKSNKNKNSSVWILEQEIVSIACSIRLYVINTNQSYFCQIKSNINSTHSIQFCTSSEWILLSYVPATSFKTE